MISNCKKKYIVSNKYFLDERTFLIVRNIWCNFVLTFFWNNARRIPLKDYLRSQSQIFGCCTTYCLLGGNSAASCML